MNWYFLAAINVLSISIGTLFQKLSMKKDKSNPISSAIVFQLLLTVFTFVFALMNGYHFPPLWLLPSCLLSGVLYGIGTIAIFRAYKSIDASEGSVLTGAGVIITIAASFIFLHDVLTAPQLLGVILILGAVVLINLTQMKFHLNTGALLALLGTSLYGLAVVNDTYIIHHYDVLSFLPLSNLLSTMVIYLINIKQSSSIIRSIRHIDMQLIIFTCLYTIQVITFYLSLHMGALVSQISTISRASIILTVILAAIFLGERKHVWRKIAAAVLTTIGVLLIS